MPLKWRSPKFRGALIKFYVQILSIQSTFQWEVLAGSMSFKFQISQPQYQRYWSCSRIAVSTFSRFKEHQLHLLSPQLLRRRRPWHFFFSLLSVWLRVSILPRLIPAYRSRRWSRSSGRRTMWPESNDRGMVVHSKLTDSYGNFYVRLGVNSAEQWEGRGRVFFSQMCYAIWS